MPFASVWSLEVCHAGHASDGCATAWAGQDAVNASMWLQTFAHLGVLASYTNLGQSRLAPNARPGSYFIIKAPPDSALERAAHN